MQPFSLKYFKRGATAPQSGFFIFARGFNMGRPSYTFETVNSYVLECAPKDFARYFSLVYYLHHSGTFRDHLYRRQAKYALIDDARKIITESLEKLGSSSLLNNLHELLVTDRDLKQRLLINGVSIQEVLSSLTLLLSETTTLNSMEVDLVKEKFEGNKASNEHHLKEVSEIDVVYRRKWSTFPDPMYSNSREVYKLLLKIWDDGKIDLVEEFKVLFLDTASHLLGVFPLSIGGRTGVIVDPRILFAAALKVGAVSIILAHNHPSCSMVPSATDKAITKRLRQAGDLFDIQVIDHLIISRDTYFSFADEGEL